MRKIASILFGFFVSVCTVNGYAVDNWGLNLPRGVTPVSAVQYDIHMIAFYVCCVIAVVVFGAMFYAMVAFRRSAHPVPATFSHSTKLEIVWTVIPILILVVLAFPATKALLLMEDTSKSELTVKVTAAQWKWKYEYIDSGVQFYSSLDQQSNQARQLKSGISPNTVSDYLLNVDNRLVLPVDTKIQFLITSVDVIHAWWVIDFGIKKDAIPGFINQAWTKITKTGVYRGQCAELCGRDHGFMPIVVEVVSKEDFVKWLEGKKNPQVSNEQAVAMINK
ncbi:MAG: cytochrome c oxidase subunit II [Methylacidiphilales bacterium]|nr:cytochrome c oxidase subunit II [Candidatus Methylacidiphilales bacterium]